MNNDSARQRIVKAVVIALAVALVGFALYRGVRKESVPAFSTPQTLEYSLHDDFPPEFAVGQTKESLRAERDGRVQVSARMLSPESVTALIEKYEKVLKDDSWSGISKFTTEQDVVISARRGTARAQIAIARGADLPREVEVNYTYYP